MDNKSRIANRLSGSDRAAILFSICTVLQKSVPFLLMPLLTRMLNTAEYGLYSVYTSWVAILTIPATLNLHLGSFNNGMVRYQGQRRNYMVSIITLSMMISGALFVCWMALYYGLHCEIIDLPVQYVILIFFQIVCVEGFLCWSAKARYERNFKNLILLTALGAVFSILLPIGALLLKCSLFGVIFIMQLPNMIIGLGCYLISLLRNRLKIGRSFWKKALAFSIPLLPHYIAGTILAQIDRVMIQEYWGMEYVALYSVTYNLSIAINLLITGLNSAMVPEIYEALRTGSCGSVINQLKRYMEFFSVGIVGIMMIMPEVIFIIAPAEYADSIKAVPPIVLSCLFIFLYNVFANVEFYYEAKYFISVASVIAAVSNVILNAVFIPRFGYYAAAYTTAVCYMVYAVAHMLNARRLCKFHHRKELITIRRVLFIMVILCTFTSLAVAIYRFWYIRYILLLAVFTVAFITYKKGRDVNAKG